MRVISMEGAFCRFLRALCVFLWLDSIIISSWQKNAIKTAVSCQRLGCAIFINLCARFCFVAFASFLHSIFLIPYLCVFRFSHFRLIAFFVFVFVFFMLSFLLTY